MIPVDFVHCQQMAFVSLLVLTWICQWAFVDFAFFSADQKWECIELAEVETQSACQPNERGFLLFLSHQFQFENLLWLQFVLHQTPVHHSAIWWDRVEVELLGDVGIPFHLPHWISVFLSSHRRLVDGFVVLVPHIVHHDCSIVQSCRQERGRLWVPIQTHHTCGQTLILVFWESDILDRPHQNLACLLFCEVVAAQRNGKQVFVFGIPADRCHMLLLLFVMQSPNWQQLPLRSLLLLAFLPIILVIAIFAILLVLSDHPLHDLHAPQKRWRVSARLDWFLRDILLHVFVLILVIGLLIRGLLLELVDVGVPNVPLGDFSSDVLGGRSDCGCASFPDFRIYCLHFSAIVVELIPHRLLYCCIMALMYLPRSCPIQAPLVLPELDTRWTSSSSLIRFVIVFWIRPMLCGCNRPPTRSGSPGCQLRRWLCWLSRSSRMWLGWEEPAGSLPPKCGSQSCSVIVESVARSLGFSASISKYLCFIFLFLVHDSLDRLLHFLSFAALLLLRYLQSTNAMLWLDPAADFLCPLTGLIFELTMIYIDW